MGINQTELEAFQRLDMEDAKAFLLDPSSGSLHAHFGNLLMKGKFNKEGEKRCIIDAVNAMKPIDQRGMLNFRRQRTPYDEMENLWKCGSATLKSFPLRPNQSPSPYSIRRPKGKSQGGRRNQDVRFEN